ncbi:MAG: glycosyltransferase family 2 protein [Candidatus Edwardsbacteria bacterium]|nr:glycosyltransferase family 2 protein [Candidatus Edwardsbacteria bacterium]
MTTSHSFAVLAHGDSPYLEDCLRSLERQTVRSEVYISTSTPSPFLERAAAGHGLPLHVRAGAPGMAADWSAAYALCRTPYLTLAHQDDRYHPRYAEACLAAAERRPDCLIAFTGYDELAGARRVGWSVNLAIKRLIAALAFLGGRTIAAPWRKRALLAWGCAIPCPSVMFHKGLIGDFSFSPEYRVNLDWDAWARLAARPGAFRRVPGRLVTHRRHAASATAAAIDAGRRQQEDLLMFRRFWPGPLAAAIARLYALSLLGRR